ncbi:MAG: GIY-YIG nuclease family protein [Cocleimonas sp.]
MAKGAKEERKYSNENLNKTVWFVYMLRCVDNSLYTGVTTDVSRRVLEHNGAKSVTRYTRARQPVKVVYQETAESRSTACQREAQIKKLTKLQKEALLEEPLIKSIRT